MLTTEAIVQDLQDWYDKLPQVLQLNNMNQVEMPLESRRSLLHMHLRYLGAIMLLYRRIASLHLQSLDIPSEHGLMLSLRNVRVEGHGERAFLAATSSARILKLSLDEGAAFKKCWLIM